MQQLANNNKYIQLLVIWFTSSGFYIVSLGALVNVMPPRLAWIPSFIFPLSVAVGFIMALISVATNNSQSAIGMLAKDGIITTIGAAVLIFLYFLSFAYSPTKYVSMDELGKRLAEANLNDIQVGQVKEIISKQGYVTSQDLEAVGLNSTQIQEIQGILEEAGYVKEEDVVRIFQTQSAVVATQTAEAKTMSCLIEAKGQVAVRKFPESDVIIGYIFEGEQISVIGHDGGEVNYDKWWQIEIQHGNGAVYGWVASWVVNEINESECAKLQQMPGS